MAPGTNVYPSWETCTRRHKFAIGESTEERRLVVGGNYVDDHEFDEMKTDLSDAVQRLLDSEPGGEIVVE